MDLGMDMWKYYGITHTDHTVMNPLSLAKTREMLDVLRLAEGDHILDVAGRSQPVLGRGRLHRDADELRRVADEERTEDRHQHEEDNDTRAERGALVVLDGVYPGGQSGRCRSLSLAHSFAFPMRRSP